MTSLLLASASPRRQALVGLLELAWRAVPTDIDETEHALADPFVGALNIAAAKARAAAIPRTDEVILAADTLVVTDGTVLGKPTDADAARTMLRRLRGKAHSVLTGVALRAPNERQWGAVVTTRVEMREYAETAIDDYVGRGEPLDKAGGYAIQDAVFRPVARVAGCYLNVVGLPVCAVAAGLTALGMRVETRSEAPLLPPCGYCRSGAALVGDGSVQ